MKEKMKEIGYVIEDLLKRITGEITPEKKLVIILSILLIGTLANLYMTFRSVQSLGSNDNRDNALNIRHIEQPQVINRENTLPADSLKGEYDQTD